MIMVSLVQTPLGRHTPFTESTVRTDQEVCNIEFGFVSLSFSQLLYMLYDSADVPVVTNVLRRSPDVLKGPRVERSSPAGSYQLPVCHWCARVRERGH